MKTNEFIRVNLIPTGITRWGVTVLCVLLLLAQISFAQDFTAHHLGDYGNVTVMEVTGNYDGKNPDGSVNDAPRQAIAKEFLRIHKDEYDFVVVFTNFDFKMPEAEADGFFEGVKNDVRGIGSEIFDNTALYGSAGRLQGTIDMGNLASKVSNPLDPGFENTLRVLVHEMQHRWGAYVHFKDSAGNASTALLGKDGAHWSYLLDTKGSVMYGNQWQDNGNGTFTALTARKYYSPLDLYLMGMIDRSKVPPILLIDNPSIDPKKLPEPGTTITGTARYVTIDDIIAIEGERIPSAKDSQKQFKTAFIYAVSPNSFKIDDLYGIENIRNGFLPRYSILTDGKGLVQVASTPKDNLAVNPGVRPPTSTPRTLPPNIDNGVTWLMNRQQADGSWTDFPLTTERDTAETAITLQHFPIAVQSFQAGFAWLGNNPSTNTDYLCRRVEAAVQTGSNSSALVQELLARRNRDGGWGSNRNFISNSTDTALVLKALAVAGYSDSTVTGPAIAYLQGAQNVDGGWSGDDAFSTVQPTAAVVTAFNAYRNSVSLDTNLTKAVAFLTSKQNSDGGFGNSPSTVYDSALAVIALQTVGADKTLSSRGVSYLLGQQSENGAWLDSPFQTALAVRAVWAATIDPDLSIKPEDISIIPATVTTLPTNAVLSATVWNLGRKDVSQAKVAVYDGAATPEKKVAEQTAAFPGQSPVTLTFSIPVTDGKGHVFHVVADPDNQQTESNKNNNSALKSLLPEITYDFQVLASGISTAPNPVDIGKDVKITVKVSNSGTSDAYNVPVRLFINQSGAPLEIAQFSVDLPAGGSAVKEMTWKAGQAGINQPLTVQIDPSNTFNETNKDNNIAFIPLTVNASTLPNLSVFHKDMIITPSPAREGSSASISVLVKNDGSSTAENVKVNVYKGTASNNGTLLGSKVITSIPAGQSVRTVVDWTGIAVNGGQVISVQVDPDNTIQENAKDDNFTFVNLDVLSLPDLAISTSSIAVNPATPKSGDTVTVAVTVQNAGDQETRDVTIHLKEGGTVIGSTVIPLINGNSQATGTISYVNASQTGSHQLTVTVDPDGLIVERTKDNNSVVRIFSIQDANLWLTESYISHNGDGIKDTTDFSFRLAAPAKVSVQVVNKKGVAVRTFSGGELDATPGTTIAWDGKNDAGSVVDDGTYQIKVINANSAMLAVLPVEVDTNRSPLADALGTKYLLKSNQTCVLPNYSNLKWLPDESGLVFQLYPAENSPYLDGLYSMSPTGGDIIRLIPELWNSTTNPNKVYDVTQWDMSQDGQKIAFVLRQYAGSYIDSSGNTNLKELSSSLWIVNTDGSNLTKEYDFIDNPFGPEKIMWSPDGSRIAVMSNALYMFNPTTKEMKYATNQGYTFSGQLEWLQDSSMVYAFSNHYFHVFSLSDRDGVGSYYQFDQIFSNGGEITSGWLWDKKVLFSGYDYSNNKSYVVQFDAKDGTFSPLAGVGSDFLTVSPDKRYVAWTDYIWGIDGKNSRISKIYIMDSSLNITTIAQTETNSEAPSGVTTGIGPDYVWSNDGSALAYVTTSYNAQDQTFRDEVVIHDMEKGTDRRIEISNYVCQQLDIDVCNVPNKIVSIASWMKDKIHFHFKTSEGVILFNSNDKTSSAYLSLENTNFMDFSPNERYLTYEKYNDSTNGCFPKWHNQLAMSSLLNLTADLRITKNKSVIKLSGIASDKNFAGYRLEYADVKMPDTWNLIIPPSDMPVLNDKFTDWVPPNEGSFYVRLTVWDNAGNITIERKRVVWGISTLVTGLYRDNELIAPNNPDNPKKTVTLNYTVLDAVHLEFTIVNDKGEVVRTFGREHAGYAVDTVIWDGRDENGSLVPDGKYIFKLFDYEYTVEVDNSPPEVGIALSPVTYETNDGYYVVLAASAFDARLKKWTIQTGEGENPSVWTIIDSETTLSKTTMKIYDFSYLKNRRFRIVAEDFAGNRSSKTSETASSNVMLAFVDVTPVLSLGHNPTFTFANDTTILHGLSGFEMVPGKTAKVALQYSEGTVWTDVLETSGSGAIYFGWRQPNNLVKPYALRFKVVTEGGAEYYSEFIKINEVLDAYVTCNESLGRNNLFEQLQKLDVTVTSATGSTVTVTYAGSNVPTGVFDLSLPTESNTSKPPDSFTVVMVGVGKSGKSYFYSGVLKKTKLSDCGGSGGGGGGGGEGEREGSTSTLPFNVIYPDALACGKTAGAILLPTERLSLTGAKRVDYLVKVGTALQVIGEVDIELEGPRRVSVDSSLLPTGSYPLWVIVTNKDNSQKQTDLGIVVVFDTEAPQAQLILPASTCPVRTATPKGTRLGIDVSGSAKDNIRVAHYTLYYGIGENPASWSPTMSVGSDGVSKQIAGDGTVSGRLGTWDITDIPGSVFSLKLEVVDAAGNKGCATAVIRVDREIKINGYTLTPLIFSPNTDGILDAVTTGFSIEKPATVDLSVYTVSNAANGPDVLGSLQRHVQSALKFNGGAATFDWDGKGDSGTILSDNRYGVSLTVTDVCGNTATQWKAVELDNTPPSTSIDYPLPGNPLPPGVMIEIKGTVTDPHFKSYLLEAGRVTPPRPGKHWQPPTSRSPMQLLHPGIPLA